MEKTDKKDQLKDAEKLQEPKSTNIVSGTMDSWTSKLFRSRRSSIITFATLGILLLAVVVPLAYRSFAATNGYDLVVTSVSSFPAYPNPGDDVKFSATIKNNGNVATPSGVIHGVSFSVNGQKVTWSDTFKSGLAAGASVTVTANSGPTGSAFWKFPGTKTDVEAYVDDINRLSAETNGDNNKYTFKYAYDLIVTAIGVSPANPVAGNHVVFSATVKNAGNLPTTSGIIHGVAFQVAGKSVSWSDTYKTALAPGTSTTLTANSGPNGVNYWTMVSGTTSVTAFVDDINRLVDESNGDNNKYTGSLSNTSTTPAPAPAPAPAPSPTPSTSTGGTIGSNYGGSAVFYLGSLPANIRQGVYNDAKYVGVKWIRADLQSTGGDGVFVSESFANGLTPMPTIFRKGTSESISLANWAYGKGVRVVMLDNEANLTGRTVSNYCTYFKDTTNAIHASHPDMTVLTTGLGQSNTAGWRQWEWIDGLGACGALDLPNIGVGFHWYYNDYTPGVDDGVDWHWRGYTQRGMTNFIALIDKYTSRKPKIWVTEHGISRNCGAKSESLQAQRVAASFDFNAPWLKANRSRLGPVFWFSLINKAQDGCYEEGFGGYSYDSSHRYPAADSVKAMLAKPLQ